MKTILREELASRLGSPGFVVINVLARRAYDKIHIKGSISIPRSELETGRWQEIDPGSELVVYCTSSECGASEFASGFLETKGFRVRAYEGGIRDWAEAGLPTEGEITSERFLKERYGRT